MPLNLPSWQWLTVGCGVIFANFSLVKYFQLAYSKWIILVGYIVLLVVRMWLVEYFRYHICSRSSSQNTLGAGPRALSGGSYNK